MFSSERLNTLFIQECEVGNLHSVADMYRDYYLWPNSLLIKFVSFFFIVDSATPRLDPHAYDNQAFLEACSHGHSNIVHFLLSDKKFINKISQTEFLSDGFSLAVSCGHVHTAKTIMHFINQHQKDLTSFYKSFIEGFTQACKYGEYESVDYMLKNFPQSLQIELGKKNGSLSLGTYGFMHACENGQTKVIDTFANNSKILPIVNLRLGVAVAIEKNMLNVIKHIMGTSILKKHINLGRLPNLKVPNAEMMHYLMYQLNFKDNPNLMTKLNCDFNISLAEKIEIHKELNSELNNANNVPKISKKKLKI